MKKILNGIEKGVFWLLDFFEDMFYTWVEWVSKDNLGFIYTILWIMVWEFFKAILRLIF